MTHNTCICFIFHSMRNAFFVPMIYKFISSFRFIFILNFEFWICLRSKFIFCFYDKFLWLIHNKRQHSSNIEPIIYYFKSRTSYRMGTTNKNITFWFTVSPNRFHMRIYLFCPDIPIYWGFVIYSFQQI